MLSVLCVVVHTAMLCYAMLCCAVLCPCLASANRGIIVYPTQSLEEASELEHAFAHMWQLTL